MRLFISEDLSSKADINATLRPWIDLVKQHGDFSRSSLIRADLWTYLSENCLVKTDRASMAHGLEVRVPLLSNSLQDFALALPERIHFDSDGGKVILRKLAENHLPTEVWRRKKHGFSVPLRSNFASIWLDWGEDLVSNCHIDAPWLNHTSIKHLWHEAKNGKGNPRLMYTFLTLLQWLRSNNVSI
jgi:asparagine synthase (glutamine-hydrolysing)